MLYDKFIRDKSAKIKADDVKTVVKSGFKINNIVTRLDPYKFRTIIFNAPILFKLIMDYYHGKYREIPWTTIAAISFALLYLISPLDLIPDSIPFVGYLDDLAVMTVVINTVNSELEKYKNWTKENK